jgi:hypothetical protein
VIARGYLFAYEYQISFAKGFLKSFMRYVLRPTGLVIFTIITYIALGYLLLFGNELDWVLGFMIAAAFILSFAANILVKPKVVKRVDSIIPRNTLLKLVIFCLWLYILFQPDGRFMMVIGLMLIYGLEFASIYSINNRQEILNR